MKKKVILRAPVLTISGYGVHSRQIFRWLMKNDDKYDVWVQTLSWGNTSWLINREAENGLVGKIMDKTAPPPENLDISIQVQLPNEWDTNMARFNIGVTAAVETDKCNPEWINAINKMDLVIVPSEHTKQTLENSGAVQKRIVVVPEAFIDEINEEFDATEVLPLDEIETSFNFLIFGQITGNRDVTDRKNTYRTLKWLCDTFKKDKDVGIVLKTNSGRNSSFDRYQTEALVKKTLGHIRKGDAPPVYLLHGAMTSKEVAALYRHPKIKALVALTRGEGYGLPILESAASGLPVIATDWSGHLDFMNRGKFIKVDYDLKEIDSGKVDKNIFMPNVKWADPKEGSAKKALKKFRELPDIPKEWAEELALTLKKEFSQEAIESKYDKILSEIVIW